VDEYVPHRERVRREREAREAAEAATDVANRSALRRLDEAVRAARSEF
jgi:hypothetical protein